MYDEDRRPTGETAERFGGFPDGGLHLVVHVCVFDRRGRMLIQRRQETKAAWPGRWDLSAGGCALAGESSRQAASREREELGFDPALEGVRPALTVNFPAVLTIFTSSSAMWTCKTCACRPRKSWTSAGPRGKTCCK